MKHRNIIRMITFTLICAMTLSLFAGCSQSGSTTGQSGTPSQPSTPSQPATPTQPSNVYVHTFSNNVCTDCGTPAFTNEKNIYGLTNVIEKPSVYDGNKDGNTDTFYFSPTLADAFKSENVIHIAAGAYDKSLSRSPSSNLTGYTDLPHYYTTEYTSQSLVYKITVADAGVYEMVIHLRLKDDKERGNTFTVNEGTNSEYSFQTSFQPADEAEITAMKTRDGKDSTYMYGMQLNLVEGENIIKIEVADSEKCQHYREFYFLKVESAS